MSVFGLPSLNALDGTFGGSEAHASTPTAPLRIWLCTGRTDMRCGFDRLASIAAAATGQDPLGGHHGAVHLFVFRNRSGDRLKILYFDCDGFVLFYKRLEAGVFRLPKVAADQTSIVLRPSELAMLLDGIDLSSVKRSKRYRHKPSASS